MPYRGEFEIDEQSSETEQFLAARRGQREILDFELEKNGLMWISPTVGVAPMVLGMSSNSAERSSLGASTNPASAYKATSSSTAAEIRRCLWSNATMRLFDPQVRPSEIRPKQLRERSAWFRQGECLRLIYDQLRDAAQPMTTRELAERIMRCKSATSRPSGLSSASAGTMHRRIVRSS